MLPKLPIPVPMKTEFGQLGGDIGRRPLVKLNPKPFADNFNEVVEPWRFVKKQIQNLLGGKSTILKSAFEIDSLQPVPLSARLCGPVLEP